jgi:uncharacterized membrane protein
MTGPVTSTIAIQKVLPAGANVIITTAVGWRATINGITFNNPAPLSVTVSLYKASTSTTINVYTFNLAAGDVVADNNQYALFPGDILTVTTSVGGTNFMMSGNYFKL